MIKQDIQNYKFRPSQIYKLMTEPKTKKAKEAGELSETAKDYLLEILIELKYGRVKEIYNKYLDKGNYGEEDSITLLSEVRDEFFLKNEEKLDNDFIAGTPDIIDHIEVIDIKTAWDIWTFTKVDEIPKEYYWQLQAYMWLASKPQAELVYTLVDAPEYLIVQEKQKRERFQGLTTDEEIEAMEKQVESEMIYSDIPKEERIKSFLLERDDKAIEKLQEKIIKAREALTNLIIKTNIYGTKFKYK